MEVILNIGLNGVEVESESFTNGVRNPLFFERSAAVMHAMRAAGFSVMRATVQQSDSEITVVATVLWPNAWVDRLERVVHALSVTLNQECIAIWRPAIETGKLIGPKAEAWGDFNPEYFVLHDSSRLAKVAQAA